MLYINDTMRISKLDDKNLQLEILKNTTNRKTGETTAEWQWAGYYTHLDAALLGAFQKLTDSAIDTDIGLQDLRQQILDAKEEIIGKVTEAVRTI